MKNAAILLTACLLCLSTTAFTYAQPGTSEEMVKSQHFAENDVFTDVDVTADFKSAAFSDSDAEGTVKCWRWYYRPAYRYYWWRPVYYRPYYCYYRYYCPCYYTHFTWTSVAVFKGGESHGAMLDSDPKAGSPLAAQGLRKGDIITAIDGKALKSLNDMKAVTASSNLTVQKGNNVKFAGNLLKKMDADYAKQFEGQQEVEAGTLMNKDAVRSGDYDMYKYVNRNTGPVFGVKAVENAGNGVKVIEVVAGKPGEKAGFEINDVILEINGAKIASEQDYSDAIDKAGTIARMKVLCGKTNKTVDADVTLNK